MYYNVFRYELAKAAQEGYNCFIDFVIQMNGIHFVFPNKDIQPEFSQALVKAANSGVEVVYHSCHVEADSIKLTNTMGDTNRYSESSKPQRKSLEGSSPSLRVCAEI